MKIFTIEPVDIKRHKLQGALNVAILKSVDITYECRFGFLWLKKKVITRRAFDNDGIWVWLDNRNEWLIDVGDIIDANLHTLLDNKPVVISHPLESK